MAYRYRRKYFRKRRSFRRNIIRKNFGRFSLARAMSRKRARPEVKFVERAFNETYTSNEQSTDLLTPAIPRGTGPNLAIGQRVKTLRVTMDIIFCVDTNQTTPARDFCFFRLSLLTPRCDRATFLQHMSEVSDMGVYNHELVRVFYDKLHRFNCPKYNMGGKQSCTLKMSIPYPRNVQLDSDGNFRDNHDEMYIRGNNILSTSPIITSLGHVKLSYIDL